MADAITCYLIGKGNAEYLEQNGFVESLANIAQFHKDINGIPASIIYNKFAGTLLAMCNGYMGNFDNAVSAVDFCHRRACA